MFRIRAENRVSLQYQGTPCRKVNHKAAPDCILQIYFHMSCHTQQRRKHVDINRVTIYQNNSAVTVGANSFINLQKQTFTNNCSLCTTNLMCVYLLTCGAVISTLVFFPLLWAEGYKHSQLMCCVMSPLKQTSHWHHCWKKMPGFYTEVFTVTAPNNGFRPSP